MSSHHDHTHDPALQSWVESANDSSSDFPLQNLPFGVFCRRGTNEEPRLGVAIGDQVLDLRACAEAGLLPMLNPHIIAAISASALNPVMALAPLDRSALRRAISDLLETQSTSLRDNATARAKVLVEQADVEMRLPADIGDYTDDMPLGVAGQYKLADRITVGPKSASHGFVDDHDPLFVVGVVRREVSTREQGNPHRLDIFAVDIAREGTGISTLFVHFALSPNSPTAVTAEG
jgi:hypothetical protein